MYLVTDRGLAGDRDILDIVTEAVKGGVTMVQLREKDTDTREFVDLAIRMKAVLRPYGVPLIINDRLDVALACDADGVHIGQSDMPYGIARKMLGPDKIIGLSVENMDELIEANELDVDYIGVSPVYSTATKTDTEEPFGLDGLRKAVQLSRHPNCGIGGMNARTAADVMACGTDGIAVVSAIVCAPDPCKASQDLLKIVNDNVVPRKAWTEQVWAKVSHLYSGILQLPFIKELTSGTLAQEKFDRYLCQDEIYLHGYAEHMAAVGELIPDAGMKALFKAFADDGLASEKVMHKLLIDRFGTELHTEASIVTSTYHHRVMKAISGGEVGVAVAAILPCMWIYNRVGLHILEHADVSSNPYKEWILEYGSQEFTDGVNSLLKIADGCAATADEKTLIKMTDAFMDSALLESAFWDYGYNGEEGNYDYIRK